MKKWINKLKVFDYVVVVTKDKFYRSIVCKVNKKTIKVDGTLYNISNGFKYRRKSGDVQRICENTSQSIFEICLEMARLELVLGLEKTLYSVDKINASNKMRFVSMSEMIGK